MSSSESFTAPSVALLPRVGLAEEDPDFGSRVGTIMVFGAGRSTSGVHQYRLGFTVEDWFSFESVYGRQDPRSNDWTLWHRLICPKCLTAAFSDPYKNGLRVCLNCSFPTRLEDNVFFDGLMSSVPGFTKTLELYGRLEGRNAALVAEVVAGVQRGVEKVTLDALHAQLSEKEIAAKALDVADKLLAFGYEKARELL